VSAFIDRYNRTRRHSTCQMLSPIDYERAQARAATDTTDAQAA
jgi:transposase InsO family protein